MPKKATSKNEKTFNVLKSKVDTSHIRREMLNDVEHLVVPIVALVEGVLHSGNSQFPELALASEFGKFPTGWNGRPVTLDHPRVDDQFVSANASPAIYEKETIGLLFNTKLEDKKLKTEAWINLTTVANASQSVKDEVARLEKGEVVEVSTGLFTMAESEHGKFNSRDYEAIWREIVPDHLAILPLGTIGACSVEDGCGARVNMRVNCACQDDPKANEENQNDPEKPVVNQEDPTGEDEDAIVGIERTKFLTGLKEKFGGEFKFVGNAGSELSDMDTRAAIQAALKLEDDTCYHSVVAVFSKLFVYAINWDGTLYSRSYKISSNGTVTMGADKTRVRPETTFVPVTITEEKRMNKKEKVDALITNSSTQFEEADRAWLDQQDDAVLDKLAPKANAEDTNNGQSTPAKKVETAPVTPAADPKANATPKTVDEYLADAPAGVREVLQEGVRMQKNKVDTLVKGLLANSRNEFSEEELRAMHVPQLEKLAKVANLPDYSAQGGASFATNSSNDDAVPEMPKLFPVKA